MAQTPISASVVYSSTTPTTIYTVPTSKTAVVKGVLASSNTAVFDVVTLSKVSGGITYPLVQNQTTGFPGYTSSTYYPAGAGQTTINLLASPITLAAGDSISISSTSQNFYKTSLAASNSLWKIGNIAYLNGYYIVVGQDQTIGYGLILTSTDGITYTQRTFANSFYLTNVTYGNGYYVVVNSTGGVIHYSTDLVTWTAVTLPSTYPSYAIIYGGGKFVVGGGSGSSYYATTTPLSWTASTVYDTNTINAIAYIGTNYLFGTAGISYYTANFSTYSQPYVSYNPAVSSAGGTSNFTISNTGIFACNSLNASTYPNTFLRTSSDGASWSNVTTTTNSLTSYNPAISYWANGAYIVFRQYNNSTNYYLYSGDGISWGTTNFSFTGATTSGQQVFRAAYDVTSNTTYQNKAFYYNTGSWYIYCFNLDTSGNISGTNVGFQSTNAQNYVSFSSNMCFAANPYNGTWVGVGFYSQGATYLLPYWYGSSYSSGSDGAFVQAVYNSGYGQGYACSVGTVPGSNNYLVGTTQGWVYYGTYTSLAGFFIGSTSYVTNPTGIVWGNISSSPCSGFARSGESASSILVILWTNGQIAVTTNQGSTFTQKYIGASSFTYMASTGLSPIQYFNGKFVAQNSSGLILTSTDGLNWATMLSGVESIYNLNSQNVFITSGGISTSATGSVTTFTSKSSTSYSGNPSSNRMLYVGSTYYLSYYASLYSSSDLITWTSLQFSSTSLNDTKYLPSNTYQGLAYSGSGSSIVVASAYPSSAASSTGNIGKIFNPSTSIIIGSATASIVEIS
jgi:hypothetical protein